MLQLCDCVRVELMEFSASTPLINPARIEIEITMYDPNFVEPWHTVVAYYKEDDRSAEQTEIVWPHQWYCVEGSQWYNTDDGVVSQYAPGEKPDVTNPDFWFNESYIHQ